MYYIIILRYQYNKTFFLYVCHIATLLCLQWHIYVHHIAMKGICSSNYDNKAMFITLQRQDIFITFLRYYVCHFTTSFFSSHCDERDMSITLQYLYMFVALWNYYGCDVRVMFVTLRWQGYVHHAATTRLSSSHYDVCICSSHFNITIFITLLWGYFVKLSW